MFLCFLQLESPSVSLGWRVWQDAGIFTHHPNEVCRYVQHTEGAGRGIQSALKLKKKKNGFTSELLFRAVVPACHWRWFSVSSGFSGSTGSDIVHQDILSASRHKPLEGDCGQSWWAKREKTFVHEPHVNWCEVIFCVRTGTGQKRRETVLFAHVLFDEYVWCVLGVAFFMLSSSTFSLCVFIRFCHCNFRYSGGRENIKRLQWKWRLPISDNSESHEHFERVLCLCVRLELWWMSLRQVGWMCCVFSWWNIQDWQAQKFCL